MENVCPEHAYLKNDMTEIKDDVKKVVVGMYGTYENPEAGLIHTVNNRMTKVEDRVTTLEKTATTIKGTVVRSVWGIASLLGAIFLAVVAACVEGLWK
jgi:hypothetical protein